MRKVDGGKMNKEEFLQMCSEQFELNDYVVIKHEYEQDDKIPFSLTDEEFRDFMLEKYPNGEFIIVNRLKIFVASGAYDELEEILEEFASYFLNIATDYKVALRILEKLEENYRNACWNDGRLVLIKKGKVVRGIITEQNKAVVSMNLKKLGFLEEATLEFDRKGNLVRRTEVAFG